MADTTRKLGALFAVALLAMGTAVGVLFAGADGMAAAGNAWVSLSCVGNSDAAYVTDSGLTVYENETDVSADDYPVLRALDRQTQLEARR